MADNRSRREKLEAVIAPKSGATDGERANARALLERLPKRSKSRSFDPRLTGEVDDFLRRWRPGQSNGKRRGRPMVSVPTEVRRNGVVVGTLEFGDALESGDNAVPAKLQRPRSPLTR